jgi:hypothetical protein
MQQRLMNCLVLCRRRTGLLAAACLLLLLCTVPCIAQVDQGTITGTVTDPTGAVVPNAQVQLTDTNTGLVLKAPSNGAGVYVFSPIKIGSYKVTVSAAGFSGSTLSGLTLNVNQRLEADIKLVPGSVAQNVSVKAGAAELLETEQSSVGQTMSSKVINETPLNGRNYVFIAQLAAGVVQAAGSRGQGNGDFSANGLRAEQNNFILDGVDNNSNEVDFLNGASYNVKPPPDALAEFKVQTSDYDAQFGHSAGAVINASIKSGSNNLHGDLWEYWRNDALDAQDYFAASKGKYRQHQFGGTIGGPILRNKLFFFGDVEATRILYGAPGTYTVPTALMRQGNFSELLNTNLTGDAQQVLLYEPGTQTTKMSCNGQQNVLCANQINPVAQRILNLYPNPNSNNGKTYNNYRFNTNYVNNTVAWDGRIDWNASAKDQAFFRMSYYNLRGDYAPPLGDVLDGGGYGSDGPTINMGENYVLSETHIFSPTLANEFRFGYNWNHPQFLQPSANTDVASQVGLGGIPFGPNNGGLPSTTVSGISSFGSPGFYPAIEYENVFQILDNVTKSLGNHTLKFGVSFQNIRVSTTAPTSPHGSYTFNGFFTGSPGVSFTGFGPADFLTDSMNNASLSNYFNVENVHWYDSAYFQDDWKVLPKLTLNMGVRYDYFQPAEEKHDNQAYFYPTSVTGPAQGTGEYLLPKGAQNVPLAPAFTALLASNHINLGYSDNRSLALSQKLNFSPRIGFAYHADPRTVVRAGFGIFFGGLESTGGAPNPGFNYPFSFSTNFQRPSCPLNTTCATDGLSLNTGFADAIAAGLQNYISTPGLVGGQLQTKTPYTVQYNLSTQYAITPSTSFTLAYVGNESKHIQATYDANAPYGVVGPGDSSQNDRPFPGFGGTQYAAYEGVGMYNSLQSTLEKHFSGGLYFLAAYTWSHAMDDTATPLDGGGNDYRNATLFPLNFEYANSDWDVRNRFTFNGDYELPFGKGRRFMNRGGIANELAGGWSTDLVFFAVGGSPFTVSPNISTVNGSGARAILTTAPYASGGSPNATNSSINCAASTRNINNWYNPCAFANPLPGNLIPNTQTATNPVGNPTTNLAAILPFVGTARNQLYGPGYERINMSLFKNFTTFASQYLQVRADIFNVLNTPAFGQPNGGINTNGGQITGTRSLGAFTPNSRFFQLAAKYYF